MRSFKQARKELSGELRRRGFSVAKDAVGPLGRIDFNELVAIHDHEEYFLFTLLVEILVGLHRGRPSVRAGANRITADDVETALRMLGIAATRQAEQTLSTTTKEKIRNACPYCAPRAPAQPAS
jgi:hypothetical protein